MKTEQQHDGSLHNLNLLFSENNLLMDVDKIQILKWNNFA